MKGFRMVLSDTPQPKSLSFLKNIKTITLDWGDTLCHVVGKDQKLYDFRRLHQIFLKYNLKLSQEEITQKVQQTIIELATTYEENYNTKEKKWADCNKSFLLKPILKKYFPNYTLPWDTLLEDFCFVDEKIVPFYDGLKELLTEFKSRGWKIGLLSHVNYEEKFVRKSFQQKNLDTYFDFYSLSGDIGFTKPSPHHFADALKKSGCQPHEILHIGDHPEKDGEGAIQNGFHCGLIAEPGFYSKKDILNTKADFYITSIFELREIWQEFLINPESTFFNQYPKLAI